MNTLYIDTRDNKRVIVSLKIGDKEYTEEAAVNRNRKQLVLQLVEKILKKHKLDKQSIDEIYVERKAGSFTGVRIGVSIANALSFALGKKVNSLALSSLETPDY
jgi:tRNA threonylcarbamoyladenosine biosynthesis protein TsaB